MKKSIKVLGLAVLAMLTVASCKQAAPAENDSVNDTNAEVMMVQEVAEAPDTTTTVAVAEEPAAKVAPAEEKAPTNSVQATSVKDKKKPNPREVASDLKEGEGQSVTVEETKSPLAGKKKTNAREAFGKKSN